MIKPDVLKLSAGAEVAKAVSAIGAQAVVFSAVHELGRGIETNWLPVIGLAAVGLAFLAGTSYQVKVMRETEGCCDLVATAYYQKTHRMAPAIIFGTLKGWILGLNPVDGIALTGARFAWENLIAKVAVGFVLTMAGNWAISKMHKPN